VAAVTKSSLRAVWTKPSSSSADQTRTKPNRDYWAIVIILAMMAALIALTMWLASLGGGHTPLDSWILMP
jgi:fatty acid desaturase